MDQRNLSQARATDEIPIDHGMPGQVCSSAQEHRAGNAMFFELQLSHMHQEQSGQITDFHEANREPRAFY